MNHRDIIASYFRAFRERDRDTLRAILTPGFLHQSSFGVWSDRDAMLDAIWPAVGQSWAVDVQVFGEAPDFMVRYELESVPGLRRPRTTMAEFIRFEGDRIAVIDVFVGREVADRART